MPKQLVLIIAIIALSVIICTSIPGTDVQIPDGQTLLPTDCPVTLPGKDIFQAPKPYSPDAPWEGMFWHGTASLWTALPENGIWEGLPHNPEGYTQKIMWWSRYYVLEDEPQPELVVTGRRLDAESPLLKTYGATNAFARDIGEAMLTGVDFPMLGCWEITGQYKKSGLTFVVWVAP